MPGFANRSSRSAPSKACFDPRDSSVLRTLLRIRRRTGARLLTLLIKLLIVLANLAGIFRLVVQVFAFRFLSHVGSLRCDG